ncbi:MAG TPA: hypothetical protein VHN14_37300 [Kofleriaceae bacterium]|jgi:putative membrane protein|nr:hypothetical protein [Kofleriaceae bacterium]
MYWGYHYWGMHLFWWIFWIVLLGLLLTTGWPRSRVRARVDDDAIDTLRNRYAAGEIEEIEYFQRLAVLRGVKSPHAPTTASPAPSTTTAPPSDTR